MYDSLTVGLKNYRAFADAGVELAIRTDETTALLGPNSAGKTCLLRFAFDFRELFQELLREHQKAIADGSGGTNTVFVANKARFFRNDTNNRPITLALRVETVDPVSATSSAETLTLSLEESRTPTVSFEVLRERFETVNVGKGRGRSITSNRPDSQSVSQPVVLALEDLANSICIPAFRHVIPNSGSQHYDLLVGEMFVTELQRWMNGSSKADSERFEAIKEDIRQILGLERFDVSPNAGTKNIRCRMNNEQVDLEQLGSGVLHLIQALFTIGIRQPAFVFIDEPETSLHPRLQLAFLSAVQRYASRGVLFATHSIGLARGCGGPVYTVFVESGRRMVKPYSEAHSLSELLGEMSYSMYRELGYNVVLLVEGGTDVRVFSSLLRLWKVDTRVVVLSLGGSQFINGGRELEIAEIMRFGAPMFAIIDSDHDNGAPLSPERADFMALCKRLGVVVHVLERRAIENYFPQEAIEMALGPGVGPLGPFEKLEDSEAYKIGAWSKSRNASIAHHIAKSSLEGTDLACFLERVANDSG